MIFRLCSVQPTEPLLVAVMLILLRYGLKARGKGGEPDSGPPRPGSESLNERAQGRSEAQSVQCSWAPPW